MQRKLLPIAAFIFVATAARTAVADISIGAEAGALYRTTPSGSERFGFGFAGRLGYDIDLAILHLIPEIKVAYERVTHQGGLAVDPPADRIGVLRPMVGVRASLGIAVIAIVGFAHVGYAAPLNAGEQIDASGFVYELGGGIDFTSIPIIDIGIWGAFNQVRSGNRYDWASFGLSLTITI